MKKVGLFLLMAGLFISSSGIAAPKDSTILSSESVMISNIQRGGDSTPIGMITIWATADPIPDGWLECNGQSVNSVKYPEYVSKFGAAVPDYRGFFLRGYGGKSAALGVAQDYSVQTNGYNKILFHDFGLGKIDYVKNIDYVNPTIPDNPAFEMTPGSISTTSESKQVVTSGSVLKMQDVGITITSEAGETRPVNKAVRYIVKVE